MKSTYLVLSSIVLGLIVNSCNNFDAPPSAWNPDQQYAVGAVISKVLPSNSAIAGVREITIIGQNFSEVIDSNWVWFGERQALVKSVSLGATADTLVVYRTPNYGSLALKVVIPAADSIGTYPYVLESPVSSSDISPISGNFLVMEADKNDTVWIASKGYIYKLSPNGVDLVAFKDTSYLKPKINNKATDFAQNFVDMKFGPGGFLYATFNTSSSNTIYRLDPDSSSPVVYAKFSSNGTGNFDFDDNGNIYTGKNTGLFLARPGATPTAVGDYSGFVFVEIRVFKDGNGNKFVYAASSTGLFKSQINSDGTVGNKEQVVSIASDAAFTGDKISSFNIASDGTVFIVTDSPAQTLFILENGSLTPYYQENILPTGIDQLIWGNDRYLYLSRGKTSTAASVRFYKMGMAKEDNTPLYGAPYLGRGL